MKFIKLHKIDYLSAAIEIKKETPQLSHVYLDEIVNCLKGTNLRFYREEKKVASPWVRLTLPFALILFVLLFLALPINFMINGRWNYNSLWLENWFKQIFR